MGGDDVAVIVCHWRSRFSVSFYRESGARQTKASKGFPASPKSRDEGLCDG